MNTKRNTVKPAEQIVVTSIRTSRDQLEKFRAAAEAEHRTISQHLRHVMAREVDRYEREAA